MADKIGELEFDSMNGEVGAFGNMSEDQARPGKDGHEPRIIGKRGDEFVMQTTQFFSDAENASAAIDEYEKMIGQSRSLNFAGKEYSQVFILWCKWRGPVSLAAHSDGDKTSAVFAQWSMRRMK